VKEPCVNRCEAAKYIGVDARVLDAWVKNGWLTNHVDVSKQGQKHSRRFKPSELRAAKKRATDERAKQREETQPTPRPTAQPIVPPNRNPDHLGSLICETAGEVAQLKASVDLLKRQNHALQTQLAAFQSNTDSFMREAGVRLRALCIALTASEEAATSTAARVVTPDLSA
jgi:hypothetical protein